MSLSKTSIKIFSAEKTIIPWMMLVAIIPMLFVTYFAYTIARDILKDTINNNLMASIEKKVELIDNYISERELNILQITSLPELRKIILQSENKGDLDILNPGLMKPITNYFNYIADKIATVQMYIVSPKGKIVYALKNDPLLGQTLVKDDLKNAVLYQSYDSAKILRNPTLSQYYKESGNNKPRIYLSSPIYENSQIKAIFIIQLNTREIEQSIYRNYSYGQYEEAFLAGTFDNKTSIAMHTANRENGIIQSLSTSNTVILNLLSKAIHGESSEPVELVQDEIEKLAVYRYVPRLNMGILIEYERAETLKKIYMLKISMIILISISLLSVIAIVFWISHKLREAHLKNELLLENILPKFVIEELKEKELFAARNVPNVSIIFADIVNFTHFCNTSSPKFVAQFLGDYFLILDQLTDKHLIEKIKNIGDGYMAASGLIVPLADHANRAVNFGLDVIMAIKHYNLDHGLSFSVRIGIDSGSVNAGIIGTKRFSYDLWGNVVNTASRMESVGLENAVQITQNTYDSLLNKENYVFTLREEIDIKGIGKMNTYLVEFKNENTQLLALK